MNVITSYLVPKSMQYLQCFKVLCAFKEINSSGVLIITSQQIKLCEKQGRGNIGAETGFTLMFGSGFSS